MTSKIYPVDPIGSGSLSIIAKPISGEWIDEEFAAIADSGIERIVSLLERSEAYEVGRQNEQEHAEKNGVDFISYPIKDRGLPDSMQGFSRITNHLYNDAAGGIHTVIHCRAGMGRTGMVAAGILQHCAFKPEKAFQHISSIRGVSIPDTLDQTEWIINICSACNMKHNCRWLIFNTLFFST